MLGRPDDGMRRAVPCKTFALGHQGITVKLLLTTDCPSAHLLPLAFAWADRGHDVTVVLDRPVDRFGHVDEYQWPGVRYELLTEPFGTHPRRADRRLLRSLVVKQDACIVGGYSPRSSVAALLTPTRSRRTTHLLAERPDRRTHGAKRLLRDAWIRQVMTRVDSVWTMSTEAQRTYEEFGAPQTYLAPYPLPSMVVSHPGGPWHPPVGRIELLFVGQLIDRKRPLMAVDVVELLVERGVDVRLRVVGDGPLRGEVERRAIGLPVEFLGSMSAKATLDAMRTATALVHPSVEDGWGMAIAEAAALGLPVIAGPGSDAARTLAAWSIAVRVADSPAEIAEELRRMEVLPMSERLDASRASAKRCRELLSADALAERTLGLLRQTERAR